MNTQDSEPQDLRRAWSLLGTVEDHPTVQAWLTEAEEMGSLKRGGARAHWRLAASVALVFSLCLTAYMYLGAPHYETRIGEQRDVILADGSRITLNTDTDLTVRYSAQRRFIELERGEALFVVKHDTSRPFEVLAGGTLTRALGTEFNVDIRPSEVTVSVLEGAVQVTTGELRTATTSNIDPRHTAAARQTAALTKGQALEFRPQLRQTVEEKADLKRIDAWRTRRLEFTDTPLLEAVEEFNRYSKVHVTLGTPELGSVRVSGVFRIGDMEGFLYSLRKALDLETHETAGEVVLIRTPK